MAIVESVVDWVQNCEFVAGTPKKISPEILGFCEMLGADAPVFLTITPTEEAEPSICAQSVDNHVRLEMAFHQATLKFLKVIDENVANAIVLTIEGAISGHPQFRAMMLRMLERDFQIPCSDADVSVFWLAPPPSKNLEYIQKRGRPVDARVTLRDVEQRATRYAAMMDGQIVQKFD